MSMSSFLPFPCNDGTLVDARRPTPHLKHSLRGSQHVSLLHLARPVFFFSNFFEFYGGARQSCCYTLLKLDVYYG